MPPIAPSEFARRFRALDASERVRFVAALWCARGWETTVEGDAVVATRDDHQRVIRVVAPRPFHTPDLDDVDVLVVTEAAESLRTTANDLGARYADPAELRDRLCYGIPRVDAERLSLEHFDRSLSKDDATGDGSSGIGFPRWFSAAGIRSRVPDPERLVVFLVVLAVVGVAAVGPGLFQSPSGSTPSPAPNGSFTPGTVGAIGGTTSPMGPTATVNDSDMPPGLSRSQVTDSSALASATVGSIAGEGWMLFAYREGPDRTVWRMAGDRWRQAVHVEDTHRYTYSTRSWYPGDNASLVSRTITVFNGGTESGYVRENSPSGTSYRRVDAGETLTPDSFQERVRTAIVAYLSADDTRVSCPGTREGTDDCDAYQVVATGDPEYLSDAVEEYRATATVNSTGFVRSLDVEYTIPDNRRDGERDLIRFGFELATRDNVTVSEPRWLDEAKANTTATDSSTTSTETAG